MARLRRMPLEYKNIVLLSIDWLAVTQRRMVRYSVHVEESVAETANAEDAFVFPSGGDVAVENGRREPVDGVDYAVGSHCVAGLNDDLIE